VRRVVGVLEGGLQLVEPDRGVGVEHALLLQHQQAAGGQAPDRVGLPVRLLGEQAGGDGAGRVADPLDLDVGIGGLERLLEDGQLLVLERGVDQERGLGLGGAGRRQQAGGERACREPAEAPARRLHHDPLSSSIARAAPASAPRRPMSIGLHIGDADGRVPLSRQERLSRGSRRGGS
jgi:hypothetical protein